MASIDSFEIFRSSDGGSTESIAGTSVYARIRLSTDDTSGLTNASLSIEYSAVSFTSSNMTSKSIGSTFGVTSASNLNVTKTILIGTFSTASNYYFMLYFSDGISAAPPAPGIIFGSKIPLMIAKNNSAVAIGGKAVGSAASPRFTSYWPAHFDGGIADLGEYWTELTPVNGTTPGDYGGGTLRCCAIGNMRFIDGSVQVQPGSSKIVIAELPDISEWMPPSNAYVINACSGERIARLFVGGYYDPDESTHGKLMLEWVRNLSDGSKYTAAAIWVQCTIQYWMREGDYG